MTETLPDNLWSPDDIDTYDQLHADLATMQGSVQAALDKRAAKSYKWANDAERAAQTGMTAGDQGYQLDTQVSYLYDGAAWKRTGGGLILIRPTSVNSGVTMSESGKLTFTAVTDVNINGCFSTEFEYYRITVNITSFASDANISGRLRNGGVDDTSALYDVVRNVATASGSTGSATVSATSWAFGIGNRARYFGSIDIIGPQLPGLMTTGLISMSGNLGSNNHGLLTGGLSYRGGGTYDGISITATAAMTGSIAVYGYNE